MKVPTQRPYRFQSNECLVMSNISPMCTLST